MTKAEVLYTVPVIAYVDMDDGTVERVVVVEEGIVLGPGPHDMEAVKVAEDVVWPAWEFGY